jgi:hypothetical protein
LRVRVAVGALGEELARCSDDDDAVRRRGVEEMLGGAQGRG